MTDKGVGVKRNPVFDTARALSMLWIVAFWHLRGSLSCAVPENKFFEWVTVAALATFTFLSGYLLSGKVKSKSDILGFYKKRLQRVYPLYLVACLVMFAAGVASGNGELMSAKQLILSVFGLSCIWGPAPLTLWYLSMLLLFYMLTPLIELIKSVYKVCIFAGIAVLLYIGNLYIKTDIRVLIYFTIYFIGLFAGHDHGKLTKQRRWLLAGLLILLAAGTVLLYGKVGFIWSTKVLWAIVSVPLVLTVAKFITNRYTDRVFRFVSYASMVVYLFHSQTYLALEFLFGKFNPFVAYLLIVPVLVIACYWVQKIYDFRMTQIIKRKVC